MAVRMYTGYKDLSLAKGFAAIENATRIVKERDAKLQKVLKEYSIQFPLAVSQFIKIKSILETYSLSDSNLCIYLVSPKRCFVLNSGDYTRYDSYEDAVRAVNNITTETFLTGHVKHFK